MKLTDTLYFRSQNRGIWYDDRAMWDDEEIRWTQAAAVWNLCVNRNSFFWSVIACVGAYIVMQKYIM